MGDSKVEDLGNGCILVILIFLLVFFIGLKSALNSTKEIKTEKKIVTLEEALIK